jgi:hypothetical protein
MNYMNETTELKWYQRTSAIILLLFIFLPVGLILMWLYAPWSKNSKLAVTGALGVLFIIAGVASVNAAPTLSIDGAKDKRVETRDTTYRLSGTIIGANSSTTVKVNEATAQINGTKFSAILTLKEGDNPVIVTAKKNDKTVSESLIIHRLTSVEFAGEQAGLRAANEEKAAAEAERNKPKTSFGDGTYLVNKDIQAGTYRTQGGSGCYWERRSDSGGDLDGIIANENASGQAVVSIAASDAAFKTQRCGTWNLVQ